METMGHCADLLRELFVCVSLSLLFVVCRDFLSFILHVFNECGQVEGEFARDRRLTKMDGTRGGGRSHDLWRGKRGGKRLHAE